jgi:hypothetical protein
MEQLGYYCLDFHGIWYFNIFRKSVKKIKFTLKSDKNKGYLTWRLLYIYLIISRSIHFRMKNVSDKRCRKHKTHILGSITLFLKNCLLWDNVDNILERDRPIDDNMAIERSKQETQGYKCTHSLCNIHCSSTAALVARTRLNVTLYVLVHHMYEIRSSVLALPINCFRWALHNP